ncbi:MAG: DNA methyltransferase [Methanobacteriaceae archaeon]|nr:DNA methyltransferase [Methanobacteriaceae archaeon]
MGCLSLDKKITEKLEWGKYVSPISDKNLSPFNWYSFKHRFGSELVSRMFSMFGLSKGNIVFDPFCGGGTTLIKAKLDGYNSIGLDISPFSVFLSNVLTKSYNVSKLDNTLPRISHEINPRVEIPDVAILNKSFSDSSLKYIYSLRDSINVLQRQERDFFLFSLLSILNSVSKAKKSGGFLRITDQKKVPAITIENLFIKTSEKLINDVKTFKYSGASAKAIIGDARKYPSFTKEESYDAILTSPPYPNRHDYTRIYELELLLGFINSNQTLKNLRYDTLRSHVEARKRFNANGYVKPLLLEKKIGELNNRELNNNQVIPTLEGYFEDMYLSLKEMASVLKPQKHIGLVVSNVRFAGVMIPVDELLAEIGEQVGLKLKKIFVLRYRGNSSQQMLRHKREPARESLIVWQK